MRRPLSPLTFSPPCHALGLALLATLALSACGGDDTTGADKWDTKDDAGMSADQQPSADMGPEADMPTSLPDSGGEEDMAPVVVDAPPYPAQLETVSSTTTVQSGVHVDVTCQLLDQYGALIEDEATLMQAAITQRVAPSTVLSRDGATGYLGQQVGVAEVSCVSTALGLIDLTPVEITVTPGAPNRAVATLSERSVRAGESVMASCQVFDAYGNLIPDAAANYESDVMGDGITIMADQVLITRSGDYAISCRAGGEAEVVTAPLEVTPNVPASIAIERAPMQDVYGLGQVIRIITYVTDKYGNVIENAPVDYVSNPAGEGFGGGRYRYFQEGTYTVVATIRGETEGGMALSASTQFVVNGTGPQIDCMGPADGEQVNATPGGQLTFRGQLADVNGVQQVQVNGVTVPIQPDGSFESTITTRYGVNFVDVSARDGFDLENSRTCAFQLAEHWTAPGSLEPDALMLKLKQAAVDDTSRSGGINSLGDLLHVVLNSQGLEDTLDTTLTNAGTPEPNNNPPRTKLYDNSCATRILGICVSAQIWYHHDTLDLGGPNTTSLTLVQDGLKIYARVEDISMDVRVRAAGGIANTAGTVNLSYMSVDLTSDLDLLNGRPRVKLRQINDTQVGNVSTSFSGLDGWLVNILIGFFQGTVSNLLKDQLESYINTEFNKVLDDLVGNLDVSTIGTTFNVPRLDGTSDIPLGFNVNFSSLSATPSRALFGLGASFSGPVQKGLNSRGAAIPSGPALLDPGVNKSVGVAVHVTVLNQVLHALWRAGFFDGTLGQSTLGSGVPAGTQVVLNTGMPPMVIMKGGNKVDLHLGTMGLSVLYPGVFDEPLDVTLGATAKTSVQLVGDELSFSNIVIDEFYFTANGVTLDETTRDVLEGFLKDLVQRIVDSSLNDALTALPIPSFSLPSSLATYGLPLGASLGIYNPSMDSTQRHIILDGNFGVQ